MIEEIEIPQELPFLKAICWQSADIKNFTPKEMLISYERGWHYLDVLGELSLLGTSFYQETNPALRFVVSN